MDAKLLLDLFRRLSIKWKIDGILQAPTQDDLQRVLDRAREELYAQSEPSEFEMGRLLIRHVRPGVFDTYIYIGTLPPN